ncbi:hypothetical protein [Scytonema sp. HK-05]|uniref:hypothetical protein n=1 Tax=Scytonema sp. HK-05 TaxID=1137095 RepID=UPI001160F85C|nr:hypothetical protein [Scytonema sp. HK-05]
MKDERKDKTYYQQVDFPAHIDTKTGNQYFTELPVSKPTQSKANKKQVKSKTSKKQSKSKKAVKDTTVTQKVYQSFGQITSTSNTNDDNRSKEASVSLDTTANIESFIGDRTQTAAPNINSSNATVDSTEITNTASDTSVVQAALISPTTQPKISTPSTPVESGQESLAATTLQQQPTLSEIHTSSAQDTSSDNRVIEPSAPTHSANPIVDVASNLDTPVVQAAPIQPTTQPKISIPSTPVESGQELLAATTSQQQPTLSEIHTSSAQDTSSDNRVIEPSAPTYSANPIVDVASNLDTPVVQAAAIQPTTQPKISIPSTPVESGQESLAATTSQEQPTLSGIHTSSAQDTSSDDGVIEPSAPTQSANPIVDVARNSDTPVVQAAAIQPTTQPKISTPSTAVESGQESLAPIIPNLKVSNASGVNAKDTPSVDVSSDDITEDEKKFPSTGANQNPAFDMPPLQGYAVGGHVAASSTPNKQQIAASDTVPAMLTPGEFVVNAKDTQKNLSLLKHINSGNTIPNHLQTFRLSATTRAEQEDVASADTSTKVESSQGNFIQQKSSKLGLPKMLGSLGSSSLQSKTEKQSLSMLSSVQSNSIETKMPEVNKSTIHYSLTPLIFKKQIPSPSTDSSSNDFNPPSQWSNIEELLNGNNSTANSIGFTSSKPNNGESHPQKLANSIKSKSLRAFTNKQAQIKGFAKGGQVTANDTPTIIQPFTETLERPSSPTSKIDDKSSKLVETLAHEVYYWLRQRLEIEQERYGFYSGRGRIPW